MKINNRYIYSLVILLISLLSMVTNWYGNLVVALFILFVIMIFDKTGKGIVFRESTAFLYVFTCLLMPLVGYTYFTYDNTLARIWVKYMPVKQEVYFSYTLPAISLFCLALTWPLGVKESLDEGRVLWESLRKVREVISNRRNLGIYIIGVGVVINVLVVFLPGVFQFFATLFFFGSFAGLLYLYFAPPFKYKKLIIVGFLVYIVSIALSSGMFTIVAYMSITLFSFFVISKKRSLLKNVVIMVLAIGFMLLLQVTKGSYRKYIWKSVYTGNKAVLFSNLFLENMKKGELLFDDKVFFNTYIRTNQGFNVGLVMRRIPSYQPYDNGNNLMKVVAASIVPRFLWPDKPEAGGKFNMKYYAGYPIKGFSTNIGPLGEAYGSFGVRGGIIYMFFLGIFIRWAYKRVFIISRKVPSLICWIPVLFYQITYSGETDTLQILNSLIKSAFFVWLLYKFLPGWFGAEKKETRRQPVIKSVLQ